MTSSDQVALRQSLFKLWALTAAIWVMVSLTFVAPLYQKHVFEARLTYFMPSIATPLTWNAPLPKLVKLYESILHPRDVYVIDVPRNCDQADDYPKGNEVCWGTTWDFRQLVPASNLTDEELIVEQYRKFGHWKEIGVFTKAWILLKLGLVCIHGPLTVLLLGAAINLLASREPKAQRATRC